MYWRKCYVSVFPVTMILRANYGKASHESWKMFMFFTGLGKETVKLLCNLKILKIPAYTSWAEFVHGANKWYFQPHLTKYLIC